jgi:hypothetical protein
MAVQRVKAIIPVRRMSHKIELKMYRVTHTNTNSDNSDLKKGYA